MNVVEEFAARTGSENCIDKFRTKIQIRYPFRQNDNINILKTIRKNIRSRVYQHMSKFRVIY